MNDNEKDKNAINAAEAPQQARAADDGRELRSKLHSYNWLGEVPGDFNDGDIVEVSFKNTRRGFYRNSQHLPLAIGDLVAVEANPGHDIGRVSMTGRLVKLQMKRVNLRPDAEILRVFRKAKPNDIARYEDAKAKEVDTMIRSRKIAEELKLNMKIGDVEYQGDGNKAIFYYIADERVDFRQLIKVLAETFRVRIEMKQIGARQEAGRIGGLGPCGRPLCCTSWMTNFVSVATSAARYQDISLNPQKLAGQCAKLKCCLNYEVDAYVEGVKRLPSREVVLETKTNSYFHFKTDIFKREITYSSSKEVAANLVTIDAGRAFEVIALNKRGIKPGTLPVESGKEPVRKEFEDVVGQDSVTRFDKKNRPNTAGNRKKKKKGGGENHAPVSTDASRSGNPSANQAGAAPSPAPSSSGTESQPNAPQREKGPRSNNNRRPDNRRNNAPRRDNNRRGNEGNPERENRRNNEAASGQNAPRPKNAPEKNE